MLLEQVGAWDHLPNCYSMVIEAFAASSDSRKEEIIMFTHWKLREFLARISAFDEQVLFGLGYPSLAKPGLIVENVKDRSAKDKSSFGNEDTLISYEISVRIGERSLDTIRHVLAPIKTSFNIDNEILLIR
jgi:hypothetical protein